jgi:hypothetical protein
MSDGARLERQVLWHLAGGRRRWRRSVLQRRRGLAAPAACDPVVLTNASERGNQSRAMGIEPAGSDFGDIQRYRRHECLGHDLAIGFRRRTRRCHERADHRHDAERVIHHTRELYSAIASRALLAQPTAIADPLHAHSIPLNRSDRTLVCVNHAASDSTWPIRQCDGTGGKDRHRRSASQALSPVVHLTLFTYFRDTTPDDDVS